MNSHPSRIVCLTAETTETLYLLGEGDRVLRQTHMTIGEEPVPGRIRTEAGR